MFSIGHMCGYLSSGSVSGCTVGPETPIDLDGRYVSLLGGVWSIGGCTLDRWYLGLRGIVGGR
jgi:hypothetical protein